MKLGREASDIPIPTGSQRLIRPVPAIIYVVTGHATGDTLSVAASEFIASGTLTAKSMLIFTICAIVYSVTDLKNNLTGELTGGKTDMPGLASDCREKLHWEAIGNL